MWNRGELKAKAKTSLKANYWKTVLAALVIAAVVGGSGYGGSFAQGGSLATTGIMVGNPPIERVVTRVEDDGSKAEAVERDEPRHVEHVRAQGTNAMATEARDGASAALFAMLALVCLLALVLIAGIIAFDLLVCKPLEVGASRFFLRNLNQRAEVSEMGCGFDRNFLENVKTLFFRDLYMFLWSLLLVVPGIVKFYEYRMIPYLLADDPSMTRERAFAQSRELMDGNKWKAFVLDLSFLGWDLLSLCTLGILDCFYVAPYKQMTSAALYEALRYGSDASMLPVASDEDAMGAVPPVPEEL